MVHLAKRDDTKNECYEFPLTSFEQEDIDCKVKLARKVMFRRESKDVTSEDSWLADKTVASHISNTQFHGDIYQGCRVSTTFSSTTAAFRLRTVHPGH